MTVKNIRNWNLQFKYVDGELWYLICSLENFFFENKTQVLKELSRRLPFQLFFLCIHFLFYLKSTPTLPLLKSIHFWQKRQIRGVLPKKDKVLKSWFRVNFLVHFSCYHEEQLETALLYAPKCSNASWNYIYWLLNVLKVS